MAGPSSSAVQAAWMEERQAQWLYLALAEVEPRSSKLFVALADENRRQLSILEARGAVPVAFEPGWWPRALVVLVRYLGIHRVRPLLAAAKVRGLPTVPLRIESHPTHTSATEVGLRHRGIGGGTLRASVFGISDGLVSNTCLLLGVGAANPELTLMTGVAGWLAGALSMAAGEYISVQSQTEMAERQLALEAEELEQYPEEEARELSLIYQSRGLDAALADQLAAHLVSSPAHALNALAREELGLNPDDLGSAWAAAGSSFVSFTVGAWIPLLPLLFLSGGPAVAAMVALSGVALAVVGALIGLFSGRSVAYGALRMLALGAGAGALSYGIGRMFGAVV